MIVTTYTRSVRRQKTKRLETFAAVYSTKTETPMHAHIRNTQPNAQTHRNPERVITHFCVGLPLEKAIVVGGERIA